MNDTDNQNNNIIKIINNELYEIKNNLLLKHILEIIKHKKKLSKL